ncbi:hypothetical protein ES703_62621 [subsurface metagenome]
MHFPDEIAQHRLGDFEVADYAVFEGSYCANRAGCFAEHLVGNQTDSFAIVQNDVGSFTNCNYGGFIEDNTFATDTNQSGASTEVDAHIHTEPT